MRITCFYKFPHGPRQDLISHLGYRSRRVVSMATCGSVCSKLSHDCVRLCTIGVQHELSVALSILWYHQFSKSNHYSTSQRCGTAGTILFFFMGRPRALIINLRSPQRPLMDKRNFNRLIKSKSVKIIPTTQRCTELFINYQMQKLIIKVDAKLGCVQISKYFQCYSNFEHLTTNQEY